MFYYPIISPLKLPKTGSFHFPILGPCNKADKVALPSYLPLSVLSEEEYMQTPEAGEPGLML